MAVVASPEYQDLEHQLKETGNMLAQPLSVDELLPLLDRIEHHLSRVEQSPPKSMLDALSLSMNTLVEDRFLRHSDVDVKVAVASCISEITRITAPDAPYEDDKMKDVFQLIVSSFKDLSDQSSRSYTKRASILETVAKVRSCVVMLDLECDGLIVQMFQHFLKAIRDYHPENVFSSMETIMALVLEESEDISLELLTPILASVKKDDEEVLPVARKLGEKVFEKAADKLKFYLVQAVKSLGVPLEDYSQVVAVICNKTAGAIEQNDDNASGQLAEETKLTKASSEAAQAEESKLTPASSEETTQVAKERVTEGPCPEEVDAAVDRSPKSVMSNGLIEPGNEETSIEQEPAKKPEQEQPANESLNITLTSKVDTDDSDAGKSIKSESKPEKTAKKRGRKSNTITNLKEPSDSSQADSEKEAEKLRDCQKNRSMDVRSSPGEDPPIEADTISENENDTDTLPSSPKTSSPKALQAETAKAASSSPSQSLPDESRLKKTGRPKKKPSSIKIDEPPMDVVPAKAPEGTSESEVKLQRRGKKALAGIAKEDKVPVGVVKSKSEGGSISDSEEKTSKQSSKKVDADDEDAKSLRQSVKKGDAGDSEAKPLRQSGKKRLTSPEAKPISQTAKKGDASGSEAKPQKQSGKRGITSHSLEDKSSLKKKEDGKKRGRGQDATVKDLAKSTAEEDELVSPPKSTTKSSKEEDHFDEPNTTTSKRKRTPGKEKASETAGNGSDLVGVKVKVWWPKDRAYYDGVIESYDPVKKRHTVHYTDDEVEVLNLSKEKWEILEGASTEDVEQAVEDSSPNGSSETHKKKKKAKTDSELVQAQDSMDISPKRVGAASSSKSKASASISGRKSKVEGKVDNKSKDIASKSGGKSEDVTKERSKKSSGRSVDEPSTPKSVAKSKDVDVATPKTIGKSKYDASKIVNKSKGKTHQTGSKSNANGSGKMKSSLSKVLKESEDEKENSVDSEKTTDDVKEKSPETTSKVRDSGTKSGKKRKKRS